MNEQRAPLAERHCVPCRRGTPPLSPAQETPLVAQMDGWQIEEVNGHRQLAKDFAFRDFVGAVDFVNRITPIAETEGHHPDLVVSWGRVGVRLWTHAAGGLTENDFILAARIDELTAG